MNMAQRDVRQHASLEHGGERVVDAATIDRLLCCAAARIRIDYALPVVGLNCSRIAIACGAGAQGARGLSWCEWPEVSTPASKSNSLLRVWRPRARAARSRSGVVMPPRKQDRLCGGHISRARHSSRLPPCEASRRAYSALHRSLCVAERRTRQPPTRAFPRSATDVSL